MSYGMNLLFHDVKYNDYVFIAGTSCLYDIIKQTVQKLNQFQALPSNVRPIKKWDDPDEAWLGKDY